MKTVMLIVPSLIRGGVERIVSIISKELNKFFEIYVVIYHGPVEYEIEGNLINLKTPSGSFLRKINNTFQRVRKLKKLIKDISPNYIVSFMGNLQPILTLNPVIVSIHNDPDFLFLYKKCLLKTIYKFPNVKKIITVSKGIEKKLNNNYNLKKTKTIYNPIDLKLIKQKLLAQKPMDFDYILAVGRLCKLKGFDILINAFAKSNLKNKIKLIILGEGKERNNLEKLIDELDLKSQVLLYGKVDNPFIYMKHATFFVLSSRSEGFGIVIIESLACETPVIATNCESGPSEIIENGENGILVPVEDVESLKVAMDELFFNKELQVKLKTNAGRSVKKYDIENVVKDWIKLFEGMNILK